MTFYISITLLIIKIFMKNGINSKAFCYLCYKTYCRMPVPLTFNPNNIEAPRICWYHVGIFKITYTERQLLCNSVVLLIVLPFIVMMMLSQKVKKNYQCAVGFKEQHLHFDARLKRIADDFNYK